MKEMRDTTDNVSTMLSVCEMHSMHFRGCWALDYVRGAA